MSSGLENCKRAMDIAEREFKIPQVLQPEHFASPHLDELSGMTYLSYFMKVPNDHLTTQIPST